MEAALSKDLEDLSLSPNEQIPTKEQEESTPIPTEPSGLIFAEEYLVKTIQWKDKPVQIITQNGIYIHTLYLLIAYSLFLS